MSSWKALRRVVRLLNVAVILVLFVRSAEAVDKPEPFGPLPGPAQWAWHKAEYRMFGHFGMKTFHPSSVHLGSGKEDPKSIKVTRDTFATDSVFNISAFAIILIFTALYAFFW